LAFVPSIEAAEELAELVPNSASVNSKTPKRQRNKIIEGFKDGSIKVVFNVLVLSVGFDHPELDAIIHARATNSMAIYYQTLGRGVRIAPNKKDCKIIDLAGNSLKFGKIEELNFEDIDGYGWGMFAKERLVTGIPMSEGLHTDKEFLRYKKETRKSDFNLIFGFGKYKGEPIEQVWNKDKNYVMWVTSDNFEPSNPNAKAFKSGVCEFVNIKLFA
jgi:superfamily II DNA/RNA helicase